MTGTRFGQLADELEHLIEANPAQEGVFQKFFSENPAAFISPVQHLYDNKWAERAHLPDGIRPDLVLVCCQGIIQVVELEVPNVGRMFDDQRYACGRFLKSISQINKYKEVFESRRSAIQQVPELSCFTHVSGLLVVGLQKNLKANERQRLSETRAHALASGIDIVTFDQYVEWLRTSEKNHTDGVQIS